jgi:hypothetical protein
MAKKKKKSPKVVETKKRKRKSKPTQLSSFVGSKKKRSPRPERRQLKAILKLILTPMVEARVNALITIVKWYDAAIDWIREDDRKSIKLQTMQKQRILDSIDGIRQMSLNTNNIVQREELLKKLIGKFEEALKGIYRTKSIASAYTKLSKVKKRLDRQAERTQVKYSKVIEILQDALKPKNAQGQSVQFKVGDMKDGAGNIKERSVSIDFRSFMYAKSYAQKMVTIFKQDGLLPLVLKEIPWLARVGAHKPNEEDKGKFIIDIHKEISSIFEMLTNLTDYCRTNSKVGRRLVKIKRKKRKKK